MEDDLNDIMLDSPQLPDGFQPLDYELLEYVGVIPPQVIERLASELKAREGLVTRLRTSNDRLARASARVATAARCSRKTLGGDAASATAAAEVVALQAEADAEAARSAKAMDKAQNLQIEILQVEESTEAELARIALRIERAEQEACDSESGLEAQDEDDDRLDLHEARATLHRLRERASQLSRTRDQAERRAQQRDQELRLLCADRGQLRAEVQEFRSRTAAFECAERQEEELRNALKDARLKLRRLEKAATAAPHDAAQPPATAGKKPPLPARSGTPQRGGLGTPQRGSTVPRASTPQRAIGSMGTFGTPRRAATPRGSSEAPPRRCASTSRPDSARQPMPKANARRPRSPVTPQRKAYVERVQRSLPVGGADVQESAAAKENMTVGTVVMAEGQVPPSTPQRASPRRGCSSRGKSDRSLIMSVPSPLRAMASWKL